MPQVQVNIGTAPNDGTGDTVRAAFNKVNLNATDAETRLVKLELNYDFENWSASETYVANQDSVWFSGKPYRCIVNTLIGESPATNPTKWRSFNNASTRLRPITFRQTFIGTGSQTQFQLTSSIGNGTFTEGVWDANNIKTILPSHITTNDTLLPIYDGVIPVIRTRISVTSISATGLVTLNKAPLNGQEFYVWYWYAPSEADLISDYVREEYVGTMEADYVDLEARIEASKASISYARFGITSDFNYADGQFTVVNANGDNVFDYTNPALGAEVPLSILSEGDNENHIDVQTGYIKLNDNGWYDIDFHSFVERLDTADTTNRSQTIARLMQSPDNGVTWTEVPSARSASYLRGNNGFDLGTGSGAVKYGEMSFTKIYEVSGLTAGQYVLLKVMAWKGGDSSATVASKSSLFSLDVKKMDSINISLADATTLNLATQAEAEAGSDNTKWMSPLRVNQAIAALQDLQTAYENSSGTLTVNANGPLTITDTNNDTPLLLRGPFRQLKMENSSDGKQWHWEIVDGQLKFVETGVAIPFIIDDGLGADFFSLLTNTNSRDLHLKSTEGIRLVLEADTNNSDELDTGRIVIIGDGGTTYGIIGHTPSTNIGPDGEGFTDATSNSLGIHNPTGNSLHMGVGGKSYLNLAPTGFGELRLKGTSSFDSGFRLSWGDGFNYLEEDVDDDMLWSNAFGRVSIHVRDASSFSGGLAIGGSDTRTEIQDPEALLHLISKVANDPENGLKLTEATNTYNTNLFHNGNGDAILTKNNQISTITGNEYGQVNLKASGDVTFKEKIKVGGDRSIDPVSALELEGNISMKQRDITTANPSAIVVDDGHLNFFTDLAAPTITLPLASVGKVFIPFSDAGRNAQANNVIFNRAGTDTLVDTAPNQTSTTIAISGFTGGWRSNGVDTWYLEGNI